MCDAISRLPNLAALNHLAALLGSLDLNERSKISIYKPASEFCPDEEGVGFIVFAAPANFGDQHHWLAPANTRQANLDLIALLHFTFDAQLDAVERKFLATSC